MTTQDSYRWKPPEEDAKEYVIPGTWDIKIVKEPYRDEAVFSVAFRSPLLEAPVGCSTIVHTMSKISARHNSGGEATYLLHAWETLINQIEEAVLDTIPGVPGVAMTFPPIGVPPEL